MKNKKIRKRIKILMKVKGFWAAGGFVCNLLVAAVTALLLLTLLFLLLPAAVFVFLLDPFLIMNK